MRTRGGTIGLALLLVAGCEHAAPFTTPEQGERGPFSDALPVRLTYAPGADLMPAFDEEGRSVVYVYARGTADRDRCLAVIPVAGGTRTAEACALPLEGAGILDAFSFPALAQGRIVANRHGNVPTVPAPSTGSLQLVRADSAGDRRVLLPLMVTPPEGTRPWFWLVTPAWTGTDRIVAIAAEHAIGSWNPFVADPPRPYDTLYVGSAIVQLDLTTTPVTRTVLAPLPGAAMLAADRAAGRLYVVRPTERTPGLNIDAARLADTLYRLPLSGGPPEPIWGASRGASELMGGVLGLAAGGGRIFLSEGRGAVPPGARPQGAQTVLRELLADGTLRTIATAPGAVAGRFGRIAASPDGRLLVAEVHTAPGQADLYLLRTDP